MKHKLPPEVRLRRVRHPFSDAWNSREGAFCLTGPYGRELFVIASVGGGWDHVSVSVADAEMATPSWAEMCYIKDLFFEPDESVIQYHPPHERYVNIDRGCLHLWRPQDAEIPMPPLQYV